MPQPVNKILKVLFDVKPVDQTGRVDVRKIYRVEPIINLQPTTYNLQPAKKNFFFGTWDESVGVKDLALVDPAQHVGSIRGNLSVAKNKETPQKGVSFESLKTRSISSKTALTPGLLSLYSRASDLSTLDVDKSEAPVDSTGLAPVTPGVKAGYLLHNTTSPLLGLKESYQKKPIKQNPVAELEKYLNSRVSIRRELKAVGAKIEKSESGKPKVRPIPSIKYQVLGIKERESETLDTEYLIHNTKYEELDENHEAALRQINEKVKLSSSEELVGEPRKIDPFEWASDIRPSPEIESWARYAKEKPRFTIYDLGFKNWIDRLIVKLRFNLNKLKLRLNLKKLAAVGVIGFSALTFTSFGQYGISVKNEVMKESNLAVANLEQASESLRVFDFEAASNNFAEAYEEFSKAGDSLNFMGASITSLFAELPGAGKLKSAKNLVEAGKLLAEAGKSMSDAVNSLSQTGAILNPNYELRITNYEFSNLKKLLIASGKNLSKASALLAKVNADALPEDKRESFSEFQSKLPELEGIVSDAVEYTAFLENLLGSNGTKKYLVLFQNDSELRPTGGFPGTYAVVTFENGRLADFLVDDVYNLDGQMKENIIPPKPLQHITPNWGMRDANWFIDFSVSARKIMEFYEKITSRTCNDFTSPTCKGVDGVFTMSPRMISDILKVVGPIEMLEYGYAINDENFISTIQAEVEYGDNREQPKQIVKDMAPRLLERIYSAKPGQWLDIFNVFISGLDQKDILMYFKDLNLESFAAEKGFGGLIIDPQNYADQTQNNAESDYLMVTFTNIKGSKTDRVTDNSVKLKIEFNGRDKRQETRDKVFIKHKLTITRQHNGGSSRYGFYNRQNPAYVRVLVPEGSELLSISGNSDPGFKPLINYSGTDFRQDDDLFKFESGFDFDSEKRVSTYKESGKTGFAFWLVTDPGERKTVELEYAVPINDTSCPLDTPCPRTIYIQKQPGLEVNNFEFQVGEDYIYNGKFEKDLELRFKAE